MALQHRHVNKEINIAHAAADIQFHSAAVSGNALILLCVVKRHIITFTDFLIAAGLEGICRLLSHPGAFGENNILKTMAAQVFHDTRQDLSVGGGSVGRIGGGDKIGLDGDPFLPVSDQIRKSAFLKEFFRHFLIFGSACNINLVSFHICFSIFFYDHYYIGGVKENQETGIIFRTPFVLSPAGCRDRTRAFLPPAQPEILSEAVRLLPH